jgi:hypothetical protein
VSRPARLGAVAFMIACDALEGAVLQAMHQADACGARGDLAGVEAAERAADRATASLEQLIAAQLEARGEAPPAAPTVIPA